MMRYKPPEAMAPSEQESVTRLLLAVREGDREALNALFPHIYDELHALARRRRARWHGDFTVNTTALVHEAYLKLADQTSADWSSRAHFFAVAAKAMRHILIDYAERRRARKRGGDVEKVSLEADRDVVEEAIALTDDQADQLVALGEALKTLERAHPRQAQIVECKFFSRMTNQETATALGLSESTVKRGWLLAQAWLHRQIEQNPMPGIDANPET